MAERLAEGTGLRPVYIATSHAADDEMREKIRLHQERRGQRWTTYEIPIQIEENIARHTGSDVILIDCITMWVMNLMAQKLDPATCVGNLLQTLKSADCSVILVSGETGMGIIPDNRLSRQFNHCLSAANQAIAAQAELVILTVAGLPVMLKGNLPEWL